MALPHDLRDRQLRSYVETPPAPPGQPDNPTAQVVTIVDSQGAPLAEVGGAINVAQGPPQTGLNAWPVFLVDASGNRIYGTSTAATLSDAMANPTVPGAAAYGMVFAGTTWERMATGSADTITGSVKAIIVGADGNRMGSAQGMTDPANGARLLPVAMCASFDGTSFNKLRTNEDRGAVITAVAATTGAASADLTNYNARGVVVCINITSGTGLAITCLVKGKDAGGGVYQTLITSTSLTTTGTVFLTVYPGVTVATNLAVSAPVPRVFSVNTTHGNATAATYTVGVNLIW